MKETWIQLDFYQRLLKDSKKGSKVLLDWGTSKGVTWLDRIQDPHSIFCEKRENLSGYEIRFTDSTKINRPGYSIRMY